MPLRLCFLLFGVACRASLLLDGSCELGHKDCSTTSDDTNLLAGVLKSVRSDVSQRRAAILSSGSSKTSVMLSDLQLLTEKVVRGEETISNATKVVLSGISAEMDNILKMTGVEHDKDQEAVDDAFKAIDACGTTTIEALKDVALSKTAMDEKNSNHTTCRNREKEVLEDKIEKCDAFQKFASRLDPPACMSAFPKGPSKATADCVAAIKKWSDTTDDEYGAAQKRCDDAVLASEQKRDNCNEMQGTFESHACTYALDLKKTCDAQPTCREREEAGQNKVHKAVKTAQGARESEYHSAVMIRCLLKVLFATEAEKESLLSTCKSLDNEQLKSEDLMIKFPTDPKVPNAADCDSTPAESKPCDAGWLKKAYHDQSWHNFEKENLYTSATERILPRSCSACFIPGTADSEINTLGASSTHVNVEFTGGWGYESPLLESPLRCDSERAPVKWQQTDLNPGADGSFSKGSHGGRDTWNVGAVSKQSADGDVTLEFKCSVSQSSMIGLAVGEDTSSHYKDIDCAVYCAKGQLHIYERGSSKGHKSSYDDDTQMSVKRVGTKVTYLKGTSEIATCSHALSGKVVADISLHDVGKAGILSSSWKTSASTVPVEWSPTPILTFGDNGKIFKMDGRDAWEAGAVSEQSAEADASFEFTCSTTQAMMAGLSAGENTNNGYKDIDCAIYAHRGEIYTYTRGSSGGKIGTYTESTKFSVKRVGRTITFWKDASELKTCQYALSGAVYADISIHDGGKAGLLTAHWNTEGNTAPVQWKQIPSFKLGENGQLLKNKGNIQSVWDTGLISSQTTDGAVSLEFTCSQNNYAMIGLSTGEDSSGHHNDIDCALYCAKGALNVYERGSNKGEIGKYHDGTLLKVQRVGSTVSYWKGSTELKTCALKLDGNVYADTSIHDGGILSAFWNLDVEMIATHSVAHGTSSNCEARDECRLQVNSACQVRVWGRDRCASVRSKYAWSSYSTEVASSGPCSVSISPAISE